MDWPVHQPGVRFDIRAERAECEYLFKHRARVLQDRLVRLGGGDRTKKIPIAEWEGSFHRKNGLGDCFIKQECSRGEKKKRYYHAHKLA